MLSKTQLKEQMESLPEQFSIDVLIERLILIEKIENGKKQSENQEVLTESELEDEINKWFK